MSDETTRSRQEMEPEPDECAAAEDECAEAEEDALPEEDCGDEGETLSPTTLWPVVLQAVEDFKEAGFGEGDVVTHTWLASHMDEEPPGRLELAPGYRAAVYRFRIALSNENGFILEPSAGVGYIVRTPDGAAADVVNRRNLRSIASRLTRDERDLVNVLRYSTEQESANLAAESLRRIGEMGFVVRSQERGLTFDDMMRMRLEGGAAEKKKEKKKGG